MNKQVIILGVIAIILIFVLFKLKSKANTTQKVNKSQNNIIIGDSQCLFIAMNSKKYKTAQKDVLYKGGTDFNWLVGQLKAQPIDRTVDNICISVGTNGGFNLKNDVKNLFEILKTKFPNANFYTVKGSWGWGGNKNITESQVNKYYSLFAPYSTVIKTPIGYGEPHNASKESYKKIGIELDSYLN